MAHGKSVLWRHDPVILARLERVEALRWQRKPNTAIAAVLGVDEKTIRNDCQRLDELHREAIQEEAETLRARVVAELDDTRARAIAAAEWDRQAEQDVLYGGGQEIDGQPRIVYRDHKGSAQFRGNKAAALAVARAASMDKAKVLGLVVDKVAPTDSQGHDLDLAAIVLAARQPKEA